MRSRTERFLERVGLLADEEASARYSAVDMEVDALERGWVTIERTNVDPVSPDEAEAAKAMYDHLPGDVSGEVGSWSGEVRGLEPTVWGGTDPDGVRQIAVRVPAGSPISVRRLWRAVAEATARECVRVGIPIEGETVEGFLALVEEQERPEA